VVDGGRSDGTAEAARLCGARVMTNMHGRGAQLNAGAVAASGGVLVFLHGDTRLPVGYAALVHRCLAEPGTVAGAFELGIDGPGAGLRLVEQLVNRRSRCAQTPYGDQALFLPRETFFELGGFAEMPIMEDYEFVLRLRRRGRIGLAAGRVLTSPRRWQKLGVVRATLVNLAIVTAYHWGVSPARLARWYRGKDAGNVRRNAGP